MGVLEGSITFKTFFVNGELPQNFQSRFLEAVQKMVFAPLSPESEKERHIGWVNVRHPLDLAFDHPSKIFLNEYLCLGLRIDRWSIPSAVLKAHLNEAMTELKEKTGQERLGRRERDELKTKVVTTLKQRMLPSMKVIDMVWNLDQQTLRFWSHSQSMGEEFMGLFEETFGIPLVPDSPYTAAMMLDIDDERLERFSQLEPQPFVAPHYTSNAE